MTKHHAYIEIIVSERKDGHSQHKVMVDFLSSARLETFSGNTSMEIDSCTNMTDSEFLLIQGMDLLSMIETAPFCKEDRREHHPPSQCTFIPDDQRKPFQKKEKNDSKFCVARNKQNDDCGGLGNGIFNRGSDRGGLSQDTKACVNEPEGSNTNPNARNGPETKMQSHVGRV